MIPHGKQQGKCFQCYHALITASHDCMSLWHIKIMGTGLEITPIMHNVIMHDIVIYYIMQCALQIASHPRMPYDIVQPGVGL